MGVGTSSCSGVNAADSSPLSKRPGVESGVLRLLLSASILGEIILMEGERWPGLGTA